MPVGNRRWRQLPPPTGLESGLHEFRINYWTQMKRNTVRFIGGVIPHIKDLYIYTRSVLSAVVDPAPLPTIPLLWLTLTSNASSFPNAKFGRGNSLFRVAPRAQLPDAFSSKQFWLLHQLRKVWFAPRRLRAESGARFFTIFTTFFFNVLDNFFLIICNWQVCSTFFYMVCQIYTTFIFALQGLTWPA